MKIVEEAGLSPLKCRVRFKELSEHYCISSRGELGWIISEIRTLAGRDNQHRVASALRSYNSVGHCITQMILCISELLVCGYRMFRKRLKIYYIALFYTSIWMKSFAIKKNVGMR